MGISVIDKINNVIFPKSCLLCNKIIENGLFCVEDWKKIEFITEQGLEAWQEEVEMIKQSIPKTQEEL